MKKLLILVDATSYLYRAYYALPPLSNSHGEPTGAIYGVVSMLRKLLKDYPAEYVGIIFDAAGKTFRDDLYADYKATRPAMPDDLQGQIPALYALIDSMGFARLVKEGVEADDVIASFANKAVQQHWSVIISTNDKDFAQCVNEHITLVNTMTNTVLDTRAVMKKFGVKPEQIIDYLSLIGDVTDNVPGIPGVGTKTAAKWLNQYGNLDTILKNYKKITGKVGENLRANREQLLLARRLVTIKQDVVLDRSIEDLRLKSPNVQQLMHWYQKLEFKTWQRELEKTLTSAPQEPTPISEIQTNYTTILTVPQLKQLIQQLSAQQQWAIDLEATSLHVIDAELVGLSFSITMGNAVYIPLSHDYPQAPQQLARELVLAQLRPLLEDPHYLKIGHNLKYDMSVLKNYGIQLQGLAFDTMLESYMLDTASNQHGLADAALKHLSHEGTRFSEIAGKGIQQKTFNQIDLAVASAYAAEDADLTLRLHTSLWPQLNALPNLGHVFNTLEMPLISVLSRIERYGVLIDAESLRKQSASLSKRLAALEKKTYVLAGKSFNLGSPKQLQAVLYMEQHLPVLEKTPTGLPSTSESVLQRLATQSPLAKLLLQHRRLSKLKSTYTDALPRQINAKTGRVHTAYHQAAVVTGRLSSSDPNLQNIPTRTLDGRKIRRAFIAPPGYRLISADYSQIELRIVAHFSQDRGLIEAFAEELDIHAATAAEVLKIPLKNVTPMQRRNAKVVNFGLIYGMSAFGLARQLNITQDEAQHYIANYFTRYPGIYDYMERTRQLARRQGYVTTLVGRRLCLPNINARNVKVRKASERAAINAPLQGSAADIIKKAMIDIDHAFLSSKLNAHMIMQVHDELVFEVEESCCPLATECISHLMRNAVKLSVPLLVSIGSGHNWDEAH